MITVLLKWLKIKEETAKFYFVLLTTNICTPDLVVEKVNKASPSYSLLASKPASITSIKPWMKKPVDNTNL